MAISWRPFQSRHAARGHDTTTMSAVRGGIGPRHLPGDRRKRARPVRIPAHQAHSNTVVTPASIERRERQTRSAELSRLFLRKAPHHDPTRVPAPRRHRHPGALPMSAEGRQEVVVRRLCPPPGINGALLHNRKYAFPVPSAVGLRRSVQSAERDAANSGNRRPEDVASINIDMLIDIFASNALSASARKARTRRNLDHAGPGCSACAATAPTRHIMGLLFTAGAGALHVEGRLFAETAIVTVRRRNSGRRASAPSWSTISTRTSGGERTRLRPRHPPGDVARGTCRLGLCQSAHREPVNWRGRGRSSSRRGGGILARAVTSALRRPAVGRRAAALCARTTKTLSPGRARPKSKPPNGCRSAQTRCTITRWSGRKLDEGAFFDPGDHFGLMNLLSWNDRTAFSPAHPVDAGARQRIFRPTV